MNQVKLIKPIIKKVNNIDLSINLEYLILSLGMLFFHTPDQQQLRATTPYHQIFALTLFWNVGLLGIVIVLCFIISFVLKTYQLKMNKGNLNRIRQSLLSEESRQQSRRISERQAQNVDTETGLLQDAILVQNPTTKRFKLCNFLASFFFYLFWVDISLVYLVFYIFGYMGRGLSHDILAVFIMILIVVVPTLVWKNGTKIQKFKLIKNQVIFTGVCLLLWLGISVFAVITLKGACLCYYNDKYGFSVGNQMGPFLSTEWTRTNAIQKICRSDQICNLYATVPLLPQSEVFINVHTGMNLQNITIRLNNSKTDIWQNVTKHLNFTNVQDIGKRLVHSALFTNLTANTLYDLSIFKTPQPGSKFQSPLRKIGYKTTPGKDADTLKMAIGGDVSMTAEGIKITQNLISYDPDIIIIGGDNTYDDGMRTCYYSWDNFYQIFEDLNMKLNPPRLIPLIMSVGNHDVGFDSMATAEISLQEEQIPLYFLFNPQHYAADTSSKKIPNFNERSTVHEHIIGPTVHLHLDSGYVVPFGEQTQRIQRVAQTYKKDYYLFANYHNPVYPSCTNLAQDSNDYYVITNATKHWIHKFDEHGFIASFQHHTHHRKLTHKIKNGSLSENGTRYVGDGSWGVTEGACGPHRINTPQKDLFELMDTQEPNHIWLVTIKNNNKTNYTINYTVIDIDGKVIHNPIIPLIQALKPLNA